MAQAYTPGLKVSEKMVVRKRRILPLKGEVLVKKGDPVSADTIVAQTHLPGNVQMVNVANLLGVSPEDVPHVMLKNEGDQIKRGEEIALHKSFFGLFKSRVKSPVVGSVESISQYTGQVILREPPIPVSVKAYINGTVIEVFEEEGVAVEVTGSFIQGIFGVGGETHGIIKTLVNGPDEVLTADHITGDLEGVIGIGGSLVTHDSIKKAVEAGMKGLVGGGIGDQELKELLGYDLGVAITGSENVGCTIIITEGFGRMTMAEKTFKLLSSKQGREASINGATQIRAGVMRPEIIIPYEGTAASEQYEAAEASPLEIGTVVRIIREPHFGSIATVTKLPPELQPLESEAHVRVMEVKLSDGTLFMLPRANVELIEE